MHRGAAVERHIEILTQRRAKRGLVAALDADLLQHRWEEVAAGGIEDLGQRARFGLDALQLRLGVLQRRAGGALGGARLGDRLLSGNGAGFALFQPGKRILDQKPLLGRIG